MSDNLRQSVSEILSYIEDHLYFNRPDLQVKDRQYNASLLLSVMTGLAGGKILIVGEPGLGKTTSAEYVGSLLYRIPLGTIWESEVSGHPEQTEEKIVGRPNLGELNRGREEVVWSSFAMLPVKVVDEINRLPETKQSMILNGVDRGNWLYLNQMVLNEEFCLFATANYQDRGTNTIVPPLMDRFDVMVESKHPGPNLSWMIGTSESPEHLLRDPRHEAALQNAIREGRRGDLDALCAAYGESIHERLGVPTLGYNERDAIRKEAFALPFDTDASALMRTFLAELSFCCQYGQKRSNEVCGEGCHYTGYLCYNVKGCPSNRFPVSVRRYAQMLAWLSGDASVDVEHVRAILPYASAHRITWRDEGDEAHPERRDAYPIHRSREAVSEVLRRYREQSDRIKDAMNTAYRIMEGEKVSPVDGEHPIYKEILRDIGRA